MSNSIRPLLKEMNQEAAITRKMLAIVPNDQYNWKPHPKSMSIRELATHIGELPGWVSMVINTEELDFEKNPYTPEKINENAQLMEYFEKNLASGIAELEKTSEEALEETWTLRSGAQIFSQSTKAEMIRITFSQIVHHRAQLGVFLRLLDVPIPGSYGPSADDMNF